MFKLHNSKGLLIPFLIGIIMLGGYYFYWKTLGDNIKNIISQNKNYSFESIEITGFPYRETLEIKGFKYKDFTAKTIVATTSPFNPKIWVLEGMELPIYKDQALSPRQFQASLRLKEIAKNQYAIKRLSIIFDGIDEANAPFLGKSAFHLVRDEKDKFGLSIETIYNMPLLNTPTNLTLRGPINNASALDKGIANWSKNGGIFQIEYFTIYNSNVNFDNAKGALICSSILECNGEIAGNLQVNIKDLNIEYKANNSKIRIENSKIMSFIDGLE